MTLKLFTLYVGIADFANPTLLLAGDNTTLAWLIEKIQNREIVNLAAVPFVKVQKMLDLHITPASHKGSLKRQENIFLWDISADEAINVAAQLKELIKSPLAAHTYLDSDSNSSDFQLLASKGEYDVDKVLFA